MPVAGRKAKPEDQRRNRVKSQIEWVEVEDVPYQGPRPTPPDQRVIVTKDGQIHVDILPITKRWWDVITAMPHCVLWTPSDWQFCLTTYLVADSAHCGIASAAVELRNREKVLGTTADYRRDLRIRYIPPVLPDLGEDETPEVTQLDDYRALYE